jgi:excisionase family DNA binding protein
MIDRRDREKQPLPKRPELPPAPWLDKPAGGRRLVEIKEACRYARMGRTRMFLLIRDGKIDAYKDGRRTLVDLNSVDQYQNALPRVRIAV